MTRISLITIGNELLKGRIINTNAAETGILLSQQGYSLSHVIVISDEAEAIRSTVSAELANHDIVLMCGGLGPTTDDITKQTLAALFDTELVLDSSSLAALEARYQQRNRSISALNRLQAYVPANCKVIPNPLGTAPGMHFEQEGHHLFAMPGVPFEMLHMLQHEVIPRIQTRFAGQAFQQLILRLQGIPESDLAKRMEEIEIPESIAISYLPRLDGIWLELSIQGDTEQSSALKDMLDQTANRIETHLKSYIYARGDQPLSGLLAEELRGRGLTLAVAESLTGGTLSAAIVSLSGASTFYKGSVTAYATAIKVSVLGVDPAIIKAHSVVSAEVAEQMAEGVRKLLGTDIGLATTGLAEPDGDRPAQVYLGYSDQQGNIAQHLYGYGTREINITRSAQAALHLCLKKVRTRFV